MLRAPARGSLVSHAGHPLHQTLIKQTGQAHQHATNGAITTNKISYATLERRVNHWAIHGIEHDDGVIIHAQRACSINPSTRPTRCAQFGIDLAGIVAALRGQDNWKFF